MTAAIFGLLGVLVGGVLSGLVTWWLQREQAKSAARAIARIVYDDFLHMQSTLVRALAEERWWSTDELLKEQVRGEDWKLLLGALGDRSSQDVAGARGWMSYLISRWRIRVPEDAEQTPPQLHKLIENDKQLMQDTFCRLERARRQLSAISGRKFSDFENGGVLATLPEQRTLDQLGIAACQCDTRRKVNYARPTP